MTKSYFKSYNEIYSLSEINGVELTYYAKGIYCYLLSYQEATGNVYPSQADIVDKHKLSLSTVKRSIKLLEDCGLLVVDRKANCRNNYTVLWWEDVVSKPKDQKPQPVPKQEKPKVAPVLEKKEYTNDPWDFGDDPNVPF